MSKGFEEAYLAALDIYGFGEVYKYLKRISAREYCMQLGIVRTAMGANKKEYSEFNRMIEMWLPAIESTSGNSGWGKKNGKDLQNLIGKDGF